MFPQELAPLSAELDEEELRAIRKALELGAAAVDGWCDGKEGKGGCVRQHFWGICFWRIRTSKRDNSFESMM